MELFTKSSSLVICEGSEHGFELCLLLTNFGEHFQILKILRNHSKLSFALFLQYKFFTVHLFLTLSLHEKWSFPLRTSSVNVTKSAVSCVFGHIYWRNPSWKTSFCKHCVFLNQWCEKNVFTKYRSRKKIWK